MKKPTTRPEGANTPTLPSRRAFFGTAAAVASVAAVPALASISPTAALSAAEPSDFARALEAFTAAKEDHDRLDREWRRLGALSDDLKQKADAAKHAYDKAKEDAFVEIISNMVGDDIRQGGIEAANHRLRTRNMAADARSEAEHHPAVISAREEMNNALEALQRSHDATGYTAVNDIIDDFVERMMESCRHLRHSFPGNLSEMMHKLEVLALFHDSDTFSFQDMLDICARDLFHLGGRHQLSDESARLEREWREFDDSPEFGADRSKATWRYVDGRGLVAVVPQ